MSNNGIQNSQGQEKERLDGWMVGLFHINMQCLLFFSFSDTSWYMPSKPICKGPIQMGLRSFSWHEMRFIIVIHLIEVGTTVKLNTSGVKEESHRIGFVPSSNSISMGLTFATFTFSLNLLDQDSLDAFPVLGTSAWSPLSLSVCVSTLSLFISIHLSPSLPSIARSLSFFSLSLFPTLYLSQSLALTLSLCPSLCAVAKAFSLQNIHLKGYSRIFSMSDRLTVWAW